MEKELFELIAYNYADMYAQYHNLDVTMFEVEGKRIVFGDDYLEIDGKVYDNPFACCEFEWVMNDYLYGKVNSRSPITFKSINHCYDDMKQAALSFTSRHITLDDFKPYSMLDKDNINNGTPTLSTSLFFNYGSILCVINDSKGNPVANIRYDIRPVIKCEKFFPPKFVENNSDFMAWLKKKPELFVEVKNALNDIIVFHEDFKLFKIEDALIFYCDDWEMLVCDGEKHGWNENDLHKYFNKYVFKIESGGYLLLTPKL